MARPPEKLAQSLEILRKLQTAEGAGRSGRATCRARTGSASCVTASCRKSSRAGISRPARTK